MESPDQVTSSKLPSALGRITLGRVGGGFLLYVFQTLVVLCEPLAIGIPSIFVFVQLGLNLVSI